MFKFLNIILWINLGFTNLPCQVSDTNLDKIVLPKFIDEDRFTKTWHEDKGLIELYQKLKKDEDYQIYYYGFEVSKDGKIIGEPWDDDGELLNVINYFRGTNWIAAYKKGCSKCKERSYGMLEISVVPTKNFIKFRIDVGDGALKTGLKTVDIYTKMKMVKVPGENNN